MEQFLQDPEEQRELLDRLTSDFSFMISDAEDEMKAWVNRKSDDEDEDEAPHSHNHVSPNSKGSQPPAPVEEPVFVEPAIVEKVAPTPEPINEQASFSTSAGGTSSSD